METEMLNVTRPEANLAARRPLEGRAAIVTGSTSGIGLGIVNVASTHGLVASVEKSGEFTTPEQIGAVFVFLCSADATQIRGAAAPVDSAWLAE
jgi:NAD(P)-dependent dehydrogenase (short-subunit alcohol dehydrogenase family)